MINRVLDTIDSIWNYVTRMVVDDKRIASIAVNRQFTNNNVKLIPHYCVIWRKAAENLCELYFIKVPPLAGIDCRTNLNHENQQGVRVSCRLRKLSLKLTLESRAEFRMCQSAWPMAGGTQ